MDRYTFTDNSVLKKQASERLACCSVCGSVKCEHLTTKKKKARVVVVEESDPFDPGNITYSGLRI